MSTAQVVLPKVIRGMIHRVLDAAERRRRRRLPVPWFNRARMRDFGDLKATVEQIWPYTMSPSRRLFNLYYECLALDPRILGDIVECGVCNGGTAALLGHAAKRAGAARTLHLFDSFQGLPAPTPEDGERAKAFEGKCLGRIERVREVLALLAIPDEQIDIIPGWFADTFPTHPIRQIAFLHVDADFYEPVKLCLETFWDHIVPGGCIVLDDYHIWEGCDRAAHEFLDKRGLNMELAELRRSHHFFHKYER